MVVSNIYFLTPAWGRFPFWLICFKGVETTDQIYIYKFRFIPKKQSTKKCLFSNQQRNAWDMADFWNVNFGSCWSCIFWALELQCYVEVNPFGCIKYHHRARLVDCRFLQIKGFQKFLVRLWYRLLQCRWWCTVMDFFPHLHKRNIFHEINFLKSWQDFFLKEPACSCCVCLMHISLQQMLGVAFVSTMRTFAWIRLRCFFFDGLYHCTT